MILPRRSRSNIISSWFAFALIVALTANNSIQAFTPMANSRHAITTRLYETTETTKTEEKQGAPQYEKVVATLQSVEPVAKGTVLLIVQAPADTTWDYEPGHVLALEIKGDPKDKTTHTYEDTQKNNGWMRGPYTVTSCQNGQLQVLLKLVGEKSQAFADATPGTPIQVGGKFKVPIVDGIDSTETNQVVLISTGVGVGPCVGAMQKVASMLEAGKTFPPMHLLANVRARDELALADQLHQLQQDYPTQFSWTPVITQKDGQVSSSVERLQACLLSSPLMDGLSLSKTHFHLIGNGQLVKEFQAGLEAAGVPKDKVTEELYFNHQAAPRDEVVKTITKAIQGLSSS